MIINTLRTQGPARLSIQDRLPRPHAGRPGTRSRQGFTILEALIGVFILTVSIGALALATARQWSNSRDVDVLDRVENAVGSDLGWLKTYASYWRLASGPYSTTQLSCTQAGFASGCAERIFSNSITIYQPDETRCATATGLADDFIAAANGVSITPPRPFSPIVAGTTTLNVANLPSGTSLRRTLTTGKNLVFLSYSFVGGNAAAYGFRREVSVMPEAASWCP